MFFLKKKIVGQLQIKCHVNLLCVLLFWKGSWEFGGIQYNSTVVEKIYSPRPKINTILWFKIYPTKNAILT